jgi:hypothetical protein
VHPRVRSPSSCVCSMASPLNSPHPCGPASSTQVVPPRPLVLPHPPCITRTVHPTPLPCLISRTMPLSLRGLLACPLARRLRPRFASMTNKLPTSTACAPPYQHRTQLLSQLIRAQLIQPQLQLVMRWWRWAPHRTHRLLGCAELGERQREMP